MFNSIIKKIQKLKLKWYHYLFAIIIIVLVYKKTKENFAQHTVDEDYYLNLIKDIDWKLDNAFEPTDKGAIMKSTLIDDDDATDLTKLGTTSQNAEETRRGMWMFLNKQVTGKDAVVENYFEKLYKKIACCLNLSSIDVPILKPDNNGKIQTTYKRITIDREKECKINGIDWRDDNTTEALYNPDCERLMQRFIAFLSKYDPDNPLLDTYGGCLANKHLDAISPDIVKDPYLLNMVNTNRSCLIPKCNQPDAYKRKQDRKSCETTICQADFNVSDVQAGGAIGIFGNKIEQECGPSAKLSKTLNEKKDNENVKEAATIAAEKVDETNLAPVTPVPSPTTTDNTPTTFDFKKYKYPIIGSVIGLIFLIFIFFMFKKNKSPIMPVQNIRMMPMQMPQMM